MKYVCLVQLLLKFVLQVMKYYMPENAPHLNMTESAYLRVDILYSNQSISKNQVLSSENNVFGLLVSSTFNSSIVALKGYGNRQTVLFNYTGLVQLTLKESGQLVLENEMNYEFLSIGDYKGVNKSELIKKPFKAIISNDDGKIRVLDADNDILWTYPNACVSKQNNNETKRDYAVNSEKYIESIQKISIHACFSQCSQSDYCMSATRAFDGNCYLYGKQEGFVAKNGSTYFLKECLYENCSLLLNKCLSVGDVRNETKGENILNLKFLEIRTIAENAFSRQIKLRILYLNNNELKSLPNTLFSGLNHLEYVDLSNNQLKSLADTLFTELDRLLWLLLHNNQLTSLPQTVFSGLGSLRRLELHNNNLISLPETVFNRLGILNFLDLHNNQLTSLPETVFSGLGNLTHLNLHNNNLT
jgi:Leucine-rich repeat (LRR) protein